MRELKDKEAGGRAFILANGPSIKEEDLSLLQNEIVIGMNASTMLEKQFNFVSKYYVVSDIRFLNHEEKRQWATTQLHCNTIRILRHELKEYDDFGMKNRSYYVYPLARDGFSKNLNAGFYYGCTTTMLAIQLAYYLGIKTMYLLGCDLKYPSHNPRFYEENNVQVEDSFTSVQISNIVNAAKTIEHEGGKLINCSLKSFLCPYLYSKSFKEITHT